MKKLVSLLVVIICIVGCKDSDSQIILKDYNVEKTKMVDSILATNPKVWKKEVADAVFYYIQTDSLKIGISHSLLVPFKQKEEWSVGAVNINGESVLLDINLLSTEHRISKDAYNKLIQYAVINAK